MTEKLNVFAVRTLTQKEYFSPGHRSCQGCAEALAVRLVAKALGRNVIVACGHGLHGDRFFSAALYRMEGSLVSCGL